MVLIKLLHIAFVSVWLGAALCAPWLLRQYARADEAGERERLLALLKRLYFEWMSPAAILAVALGLVLILFGFEGAWLIAKLVLVLPLALFHLYCGRALLLVEKHQAPHGPFFFALLSGVPVPLLVAIVALAVAKPF